MDVQRHPHPQPSSHPHPQRSEHTEGSAHTARVLAALASFYRAPCGVPADERDSAERALALFHDVATTVPAYQGFLKDRGLDPATVRTTADPARVPLLTKADYHQRYPLPELCRGGRLERSDMVAVSSGSSGHCAA